MQPRAAGAKEKVATIRLRHGSSPLVLSTPGSVNWRSGGLSDPIDITAASDAVWTVDTESGNALVTTEIEAPRLLHDFRVNELGWELIAVPWFDAGAMLEAVCAFANVPPSELLSDRDDVGTNVRDELVAIRMSLNSAERDELRDLGMLVGAALGEGIDAWRPGVSTDFNTAAVISAYLEARGAKAVCLIVGGDERLRSFRHPLATGAVVRDAIMAVVVARRAGMHVAATRVCVRRADDEIVTIMRALNPINDAVLEASKSGGTWGESMQALAKAYEMAGRKDQWREHFQGGPIGFEQREFELAPTQSDSPFWYLAREVDTAVAWNPSLRGGAKIEETYLIGSELELLSVTPHWPLLQSPDGTQRSALRVLA